MTRRVPRKTALIAGLVAVLAIPSAAVVASTARNGVPEFVTNPPPAAVQVDPSGAAVAGKGGWYFYGDLLNHNYSLATGKRVLSDAEIDAFAGWAAEVQQRFAAQSIPLTIVIVPAKWEIYSDKLPESAATPTPLDLILDRHPELGIPDVRPALRAARTTADTYSKLNGHWSGYGGYIAWQSMQEAFAASAPELVSPIAPISGVEVKDEGNEFAAMASIPGPNNWTVPALKQPLSTVEVLSGGAVTETIPGAQSTDMLQMPRTTRSATAPSASRVLALCDSTCTGVSPYLQMGFQEVTQVRHFLDEPAKMPSVSQLITSYKPTAAVLFVTERYLDFPMPTLPS